MKSFKFYFEKGELKALLQDVFLYRTLQKEISYESSMLNEEIEELDGRIEGIEESILNNQHSTYEQMYEENIDSSIKGISLTVRLFNNVENELSKDLRTEKNLFESI